MLLYIHIPFCDSKCSYCAFNSYVDKFHLKAAYMDALLLQLQHELKRFKVQNKEIETLFIGGGTPSTIAPSLYLPIFELLQPYLQNDAEITAEANPNSATKEWLEGMYNCGVDRISFGVQSFDDAKLKLLNRAHNAKQATQAIHDAHNIGFKNLSLDLIYGVAGDTKELLASDLKKAFALPINHLSAYALTIEDNTPFFTNPQMADEKLELTQWLFEQIKTQGFQQYEISNFGTYHSRHNLGYWQYKEYIGIGAGAVGKLKNRRFYPQTHIDSYIKTPLDIKTERLSDEDIRIEKIFLGLRSVVGFSYCILTKSEQQKVEILLKENKLIFEKNRLFNPNFLLADEIALYLTS
ncbi:MAG: coproporphyrinogen III oxidase family protein [Epsilonproteobacteria bacterium]|nr:coproporphyrinogen III oxidase family protein [Campylobacterota bacterium]